MQDYIDSTHITEDDLKAAIKIREQREKRLKKRRDYMRRYMRKWRARRKAEREAS